MSPLCTAAPIAGEKSLVTRKSVVRSSSLNTLVTWRSHSTSCPVRKPTAKLALAGRAGPPRRCDRLAGLGEREPGVIEECLPGGGRRDTARAAHEERCADLDLQVPELTTERRLRGVKARLRRLP